MRPAGTDLFGEPEPDFEQSQHFTPMWIARRMAGWRILPNDRVIEPSCGKGALIEGLLHHGHDPSQIVGVERDRRLADYSRDRFERKVEIICADFFDVYEQLGQFNSGLGNFPFEDNQHLRFAIATLKIATELTGIFPVTFTSTQERDRLLWAHNALVTHRVDLPHRVEYSGPGGSFESMVVRLVRRTRSRMPFDVRMVHEETWRQDDEVQRDLALAHLREVP